LFEALFDMGQSHKQHLLWYCDKHVSNGNVQLHMHSMSIFVWLHSLSWNSEEWVSTVYLWGVGHRI
jgi:hypothetical protein